MKKLCITTIGILGTCLLSTYANSASFDCNKAATWVEKTVCDSPELSKLDDTMAKKYKINLDAAPDTMKTAKVSKIGSLLTNAHGLRFSVIPVKVKNV